MEPLGRRGDSLWDGCAGCAVASRDMDASVTRRLVDEFVPEAEIAAVLAIEGGKRVIAALHQSVLFVVQGAPDAGDAPAADLRVLRLEPGRGSLSLSAVYRQEEGLLIGTFSWTVQVPDAPPFTFITRRPSPGLPEDDENLARGIAEALGCPLKASA